MGTQPIMPAVDPLPLPAPYWIFKILLVLTFILHIVVMNLMFGGAMIALVARFRSAGENYARLAADIGKKIPTLVAATVTLGVAPLLFSQVIYGQMLYTSSLVMAWPWMLVILLLTLAYYGFYLIAFSKNQKSVVLSWIGLISVFFIFLIGFFYTNNFSLMLRPEKWAAIYHGDTTGWNLNWGDSTLIPRYLHFFFASLAVGSFLIVLTGLFRWKKEPDYAKFLVTHGGKWFLYTTMVQILIGVWFLLALPRTQMKLFMGGNMLATILFLIALVGAIVALFAMSRGLRKEDPRPGVKLAIGLTSIVVVAMAIMRDILRDSFLAPYFKGSALATKTQWDVLILFLVLFLGGVFVWYLMIKKYFFSPDARISE